MPQRVKMTRHKPWRDQHPDAVVVDRRTKWGNPFKVGQSVSRSTNPVLFLSLRNSLPWDDSEEGARARLAAQTLRPATAEEAVAAYVDWLLNDPNLWQQAINELGGKDLACWCKLDEACHADALIELANLGPVTEPKRPVAAEASADLTEVEQKAVKALRHLNQIWPRSLTLASMGGDLIVFRTGDKRFLADSAAEREEAVVADGFSAIANTGGDW